MTEKQLINKIGQLRGVRPSNNWVILTKKRIFEEEMTKEPIISQQRVRGLPSVISVFSGLRFVLNRKFAFASLLSLIILFGLFASAQSSLPGSFLFPLKRAAEKTQSMLISEKEKTDYDLEIAQKRLEELAEIAKKNSVKNLAPAINEYQASVSKVADNLSKAEDKKKMRKIVAKMQELKKQESGIKSLSAVVVPANKSLEIASAQALIKTLEPFVEDLKTRNLTEEQKKALEEVENDLQNSDYNGALMKLLSPPLN